MSAHYQLNKEFRDISINELPKGEYEDCIFTNCSFADGNLSNYIFSECEFLNCDFSNAKLAETAFREVEFGRCKMIGLHFEGCNQFLLTMRFKGCTLHYSSFYQLKIKKTTFSDCKLIEVDFTETNLAESVFNNCDLSGAIFQQTTLDKADFRTANNFNIDPESSSILKARFSSLGLAGLLHKYNIIID